MIYFPEIDLQNKKTVIIISLITLLLLFFSKFENNTLLVILVIIAIITQLNKVNDNINNLFDKKGKTYNYNNKIENLLNGLKKYKYKSPYKYNQAMKYWKKFIKTLYILEDDKLTNYNHYFEDAHNYLINSINMFQSFISNTSEREYVDGMKYGDYGNTKEMNNITYLTKELYHEGYTLLYNLSLRLNKEWERNPNVHNKEIVYGYPQPYNKVSKSYDFYV